MSGWVNGVAKIRVAARRINLWVRTHRNVVEGKNPATWDKMAAERFESKIESLRGKCCADVLEFCLAQMGEDPEGKNPKKMERAPRKIWGKDGGGTFCSAWMEI